MKKSVVAPLLVSIPTNVLQPQRALPLWIAEIPTVPRHQFRMLAPLPHWMLSSVDLTVARIFPLVLPASRAGFPLWIALPKSAQFLLPVLGVAPFTIPLFVLPTVLQAGYLVNMAVPAKLQPRDTTRINTQGNAFVPFK